MKKSILIFLDILLCSILLAQPESFSWADRHHDPLNNYYNYISPIRDQKEQGPCNIFASIAAVEAMTQIYYNKEWPLLDLAESHIYNNDCGLSCGTTVMRALKFIRDYGIVSEECFPYPSNEDHCEADCDTICQNPQQRVTIPMWDSVTVSSISELKQAIMDKGPLVANITGGGYVLHGGSAIDHAVLLIGWKDNPNLQWHIKDSWPGTQDLYYFSFNI